MKSMVARTLLAPAGVLFGRAAELRVELYRRGVLPRHRLKGPVISVGNLSVGGSGKTPVVAWVAERLRDAGRPVAILSRGYGGSFAGESLIVADGRSLLADAEAAGDEPVMLARGLPGVVVAVGARRDVVGRAVEARFGPRVHLLDDGYQHLRLHRDLDVLCVSASDRTDRPLPAGRLRESPRAAARADVVLAFDDGPPGPAWTGANVFRCSRRVRGFVDRAGGAAPAPRHPFLLAGIARPERFEADARTRVERVSGRAFFPDHHRFDAAAVRRVAAEAQALGADAILTTAKDAVRLPAEDFPLPLIVMNVEVVVDDEARFRERVLGAAARLGPAA